MYARLRGTLPPVLGGQFDPYNNRLSRAAANKTGRLDTAGGAFLFDSLQRLVWWAGERRRRQYGVQAFILHGFMIAFISVLHFELREAGHGHKNWHRTY